MGMSPGCHLHLVKWESLTWKKKRHKAVKRRIFIFAALLLGMVFVILRFSEMQSIVTTLQQGDWRFVLLAACVELVWMVSVAAVYHTLYRSMGMEESIPKLLLLSTASSFVNVVAPSGVGMGGMAVMIAEARRRGYSQSGVIVAGVLYVLFDYASFLFILALGLLILVEQNDLETAELAASILLLVASAGLALIIYLGMCSTSQLGRILTWAAHQANRLLFPIIHRDIFAEESARVFADEMVDGLRMLRRKPKSLLLPTVLSMCSKVLLVAVLFLMFLSFKVQFSFTTLVAGFSIGYLYMIVSPTPSGIGVVEGALPLALGSLHIPLGAATVVALSYRGITFWVPLLVGMLAFRWLSRYKKDQAKDLSAFPS
jgi:glycosyltransferase 2 family protein